MRRGRSQVEVSGEYLCTNCPNYKLTELLEQFVNSQNQMCKIAGEIAVSMVSREGCNGADIEKRQVRSGKYGKTKLERLIKCGNPNDQLALDVLLAVEEFSNKYIY